MNTELLEALTILEQEKNISKDTMMDAIENSLISACKNHFGTSDNIKVIMNRETCDYAVFAEKEVVELVEDPVLQISLADARMRDPKFEIGDIVQIPIDSHDFGRIATQNAKNVILQKIRVLKLISRSHRGEIIGQCLKRLHKAEICRTYFGCTRIRLRHMPLMTTFC